MQYMESAGFNQIVESVVQFPCQLGGIEAYRGKAFSVLHLNSEGAFQRGIKRMKEDLRKVRISCASSYVLLWSTKQENALSIGHGGE